jgi:hypothetical protein
MGYFRFPEPHARLLELTQSASLTLSDCRSRLKAEARESTLSSNFEHSALDL